MIARSGQRQGYYQRGLRTGGGQDHGEITLHTLPGGIPSVGNIL